MQNALKRVNTIEHIGTIERASARFGISDTEFIRWPWWGPQNNTPHSHATRIPFLWPPRFVYTVPNRIYLPRTGRVAMKVSNDGQLMPVQDSTVHTWLPRLVDTSTFGVLLSDSTGRIFYMNAALRAMLGYSLEQAESRELHWYQLTPPGYEASDQKAIAELHQTGRCTPYEKAYLASDATRVPVMVGASVVGQDATGDYITAAYVTDLRPLKQTEAQLHASEHRYTLFAEAVPEMVFSAAANGECEYVNRRFYDYTGLPSDAALGFGWGQAIHPEDALAVAERCRSAMAAGVTFEVEYRMRHHDGTYRWFRGRTVPQCDSAGTITGWLSICVDVDDERRVADERTTLFAREQQARAEAEAAALRVLHLQRITAALANALTVEQVTQTITTQVLHAFDAAMCSVRRVSDDGLYLEELNSIGHDATLAAVLRHVPLTASLLITAAVRQRQTLVVRSFAELRANYSEFLDAIEARGYGTFIAVPLLRDDQATGVIGLSFNGECPISENDVALLEAIGQQCEQALERARLYSAEQAARTEAAELLAQINTVVGKAPIGMGFVDTDFRFVWVNDVLAGLNRLPAAEHAGRLVRDAFPAYAERWEGYWRQILATGVPVVDLEVSAVMHGEVFYVLVSYYPVQLADGSMRGIGIVVLNITERRRNEQNQRLLARASAVLSESLDYEATLVAVTKLVVPDIADYCAVNLLEGDLVRTVALQHHDHERLPLLEQLYSPRLSPLRDHLPIHPVLRDGRPLLVADVRPIIDDLPYSESQRQLIRMLNANSALVVPLVVRDTVRGALTLVYSDSQRRYGQHDLALAEELARRCAQTLENVQLYHNEQEAVRLRDAFLSIAAHELRTPLTSLYGNAQMLQRRLAQADVQPERDARTLQVIVSQAARLNQMIGSVLDVSRLQHGQLAISETSFDLCALVAQVASELQPTLQNHTLQVDLPEEPLVINGDELRLEQVLTNLVQNGVKYTPSGGVVHVHCTREDQHTLIRVADTGMGIPQDALPQLFQRFYRAPNAVASNISGLGIGLYVVREIIQLHGGTIQVESEEGVGTTFLVRLPLA